MGEFAAIDGGGPDKFLALGAHVYNSVAMCLDRYLTYSAAGLSEAERRPIRELSTRLKHLASSLAECLKKGFPYLWNEGELISRDLSAHTSYLKNVKKI